MVDPRALEAALGLDRAGRSPRAAGIDGGGVFAGPGRAGCRTGDASDAPELTDVAGRGGSNGVTWTRRRNGAGVPVAGPARGSGGCDDRGPMRVVTLGGGKRRS